MSDTSMPEGEKETSKPEPSVETEPKVPAPKPAESAEIPGGIHGRHEGAAVRYLPVAPTSPGYLHLNVIKPTLSPVACWRLHDARFAFDSSFLSLKSKREMGALAKMAKELAKHPMVVFGHADPTGDESYNKKLSGRRARAVYAVMVRDASIWLDLHDHPHGRDRWGVHQEQEMLKALDLLDGEVDGKAGKETTAAIKAFQAKNGLAESGKVDGTTRKKLVLGYMDWLCSDTASVSAPWQAKPTDFLARGADKDLKGDVNGCGEWNPHIVVSKDEDKELAKPVNKALRDGTHSPSRRVLVYFLRPGTYSSPEDWPCPKAELDAGSCKKRFSLAGEANIKPTETRRTYEKHGDTFACRFYERFSMWSPCESGAGRRYALTVQVVDDDFEALQAGVVIAKRVLGKTARPDAAFEGKGEIDSLGRVTFKDLKAGTYDLALVAAGYMAPRGRVRVPMSDDLMFDELDAVAEESELTAEDLTYEVRGERAELDRPAPDKKPAEKAPPKPVSKAPARAWVAKKPTDSTTVALLVAGRIVVCVAIVRDESGAPLYGVVVRLSSPELSAVTNAKGRAEFKLPPGTPYEKGMTAWVDSDSLKGTGFEPLTEGDGFDDLFKLDDKALERAKKVHRLVIPIVLKREAGTKHRFSWQNRHLVDEHYPHRCALLRRFLMTADALDDAEGDPSAKSASDEELEEWAERLDGPNGLRERIPLLPMGYEGSPRTDEEWATYDEGCFFPGAVGYPYQSWSKSEYTPKPGKLSKARSDEIKEAYKLAFINRELGKHRKGLEQATEDAEHYDRCTTSAERDLVTLRREREAALKTYVDKRTPDNLKLYRVHAYRVAYRESDLKHAKERRAIARGKKTSEGAMVGSLEKQAADVETNLATLKVKRREEEKVWRPILIKQIAKAEHWQHARYRKYLSLTQLSHYELIRKTIDTLTRNPADYPAWLRYMVLHFSGMKYDVGHGSWIRPARWAYYLRHEEIEKEVAAASDAELVEILCEAILVLQKDQPDSRTRGFDPEEAKATSVQPYIKADRTSATKLIGDLQKEIDRLPESVWEKDLALTKLDDYARELTRKAVRRYLLDYWAEDRTLTLGRKRIYGLVTARFEEELYFGETWLPEKTLYADGYRLSRGLHDFVLRMTHLYNDYHPTWGPKALPDPKHPAVSHVLKVPSGGKVRTYRLQEAYGWREHFTERLEPILKRAKCNEVTEVSLYIRGAKGVEGGLAKKGNNKTLVQVDVPAPAEGQVATAHILSWETKGKADEEHICTKTAKFVPGFVDPAGDSGLLYAVDGDGYYVRTRHTSSVPMPKLDAAGKEVYDAKGKPILVATPITVIDSPPTHYAAWTHEAPFVEFVAPPWIKPKVKRGPLDTFETVLPTGINKRERTQANRWIAYWQVDFADGDPRIEQHVSGILDELDEDIGTK